MCWAGKDGKGRDCVWEGRRLNQRGRDFCVCASRTSLLAKDGAATECGGRWRLTSYCTAWSHVLVNQSGSRGSRNRRCAAIETSDATLSQWERMFLERRSGRNAACTLQQANAVGWATLPYSPAAGILTQLSARAGSVVMVVVVSGDVTRGKRGMEVCCCCCAHKGLGRCVEMTGAKTLGQGEDDVVAQEVAGVRRQRRLSNQKRATPRPKLFSQPTGKVRRGGKSDRHTSQIFWGTMFCLSGEEVGTCWLISSCTSTLPCCHHATRLGH